MGPLRFFLSRLLLFFFLPKKKPTTEPTPTCSRDPPRPPRLAFLAAQEGAHRLYLPPPPASRPLAVQSVHRAPPLSCWLPAACLPRVPAGGTRTTRCSLARSGPPRAGTGHRPTRGSIRRARHGTTLSSRCAVLVAVVTVSILGCSILLLASAACVSTVGNRDTATRYEVVDRRVFSPPALPIDVVCSVFLCLVPFKYYTGTMEVLGPFQMLVVDWVSGPNS